MGWYYYVTCRNKACRYSVKIYGGGPARLFHEAERLKEEILTGKKDASEKLKELLKSDEQIQIRAAYLCPKCHE